MEIQQDAGVIYRCVPRTNMEINKWWLCDDGRFNWHYTMDPERVTSPTGEWNQAITSAKTALQGKKVTILVGSDHTLEEGTLIQQFASKNFPEAQVFHFGTPGITSAAQDGDEDKIYSPKPRGYFKINFPEE